MLVLISSDHWCYLYTETFDLFSLMLKIVCKINYSKIVSGGPALPSHQSVLHCVECTRVKDVVALLSSCGISTSACFNDTTLMWCVLMRISFYVHNQCCKSYGAGGF